MLSLRSQVSGSELCPMSLAEIFDLYEITQVCLPFYPSLPDTTSVACLLILWNSVLPNSFLLPFLSLLWSLRGPTEQRELALCENLSDSISHQATQLSKGLGLLCTPGEFFCLEMSICLGSDLKTCSGRNVAIGFSVRAHPFL